MYFTAITSFFSALETVSQIHNCCLSQTLQMPQISGFLFYLIIYDACFFWHCEMY